VGGRLRINSMRRAEHGKRYRSSNRGFCWNTDSAGIAFRYRYTGRRAKQVSYFDFLAFSALNFAQRAFVNFEIFALPAADIVRLRLTPL
jgi:hypothetical protein